MDSTNASTEISEQNPSENKPIDMAKIEAMLTPEQVLSDTVARKRRKYTKKRSGSRELTPIRTVDDKTTTDDEDISEKRRPKTPERRRPRRIRSVGTRDQNKTEDLIAGISNGVSRNSSSSSRNDTNFSTNSSFQIRKTKSADRKKLPFEKEQVTSLSRDSSFQTSRKAISADRKKSISDMAQEELITFLNKTKKSITNAAARGRDRFKKTEKEVVKRSQSAPYKITEQELIESFKKAQLLSVDDDRPRKYSDTSLQSVALDQKFVPKPFRPEVQNFVRQRRKQRETSNKIIEVLDPKTSSVLARKAIIKPPDFKLLEFIKILRLFSLREIYRIFKLHKMQMRNEWRRLKILWNRCMFELFLIMMFCGVGGVMFKFIEGTFENFYKCGVKRVKRDFIDLLWYKSHNLREEDWKSLARNKLRVFEEELHAAHEAGMTSYSGQRSWSFLNGVVYSLTIITTIGYGHICPQTNTGKALTIVYSIIGIPLFLIALTDFGKLFTRGIKFLWSFVRRVYYTGSCRKVRKTAHVQEIFKGAQMMYEIATFRRPSAMNDEENPADMGSNAVSVEEGTPTTPNLSTFEIDDEFNLPISVALFILISYILCGAVIYSLGEDWAFFNAFYFVFISMSTIGFGDYVPKQPIFMIISIVYLVFGLALMSMCINVVQEKLSDTFKNASAKLGATMGFEASETDSVATAEKVEIAPVHEIVLEPMAPTPLTEMSPIEVKSEDRESGITKNKKGSSKKSPRSSPKKDDGSPDEEAGPSDNEAGPSDKEADSSRKLKTERKPFSKKGV